MGLSPFDCAEQIGMCRQMLRLSREMEGKCKQAAWEELPEMELRRQELMQRLFALPIDPAIQHEVAEAIREILKINERITAACRARQRAISSRLGTLATGRKAHRAYATAGQTAPQRSGRGR